jgi:hypothetical protein
MGDSPDRDRNRKPLILHLSSWRGYDTSVISPRVINYKIENLKI